MAPAQEEFDKKYISGQEITKRLSITRATVCLARKRGWLPEPIVVNNSLHLWVRDEIEGILGSWNTQLLRRRTP